MKNICLHCSSDKGSKLVYSAVYREKSYTMDLKDKEGEEFEGKMYVSRCENCGRLSVYDCQGAYYDDADYDGASMVYPDAQLTHLAIPEKIRRAYEKAVRVMWLDADAFGLLIRKSLEVICSVEEVKGRNLEAKLKKLQEKKNIPADLAELAKILRVLGNQAAHDIENGLHPLHVHSIDDFFKSIVEFLYILPFKLEYIKQYEMMSNKTLQTTAESRRV